MINQSIINPEMGTVGARATGTASPAASSQSAVKTHMSWFAFSVALLKEAIRVRVAPATATSGRIHRKRDVDSTGEPAALMPQLAGPNSRSR